MKWGVGTGRNGTHSLAEILEVPHEPRDKPMVCGVEWWLNGSHEAECRAIIESRKEGAVDLHNVPILNLIIQMDPEAEVYWVWRDFEPTAKSMSKPGHDYWGEINRNWNEFMHPKFGWPKHYTREDKMFWYWSTVNLTIYQNVITLPRNRWRIVHTKNLSKHEFQGAGYEGGLEFPDMMLNHAARLELWMEGLEREQREATGLPVLR